MGWEFTHLKLRLGLGDSPQLEAFERYCAGMWDHTDRVEWSVKFTSDAVAVERFLHVSRNGRAEKARHEVERMFSLLGWKRDALPSWMREAWTAAECALVSIAGVATRPDHSVKIAWSFPDRKSLWGLVSRHPDLSGLMPPPPGDARGLVGFELLPDGRAAVRAYVSYESTQLSDHRVNSYVSSVGSPLAALLARLYPRVVVSAKRSSSNLSYVRLPDGLSDLRTHLRGCTSRVPLLAERHSRITWVGFSSDWNELEGMPKETNVYVPLHP